MSAIEADLREAVEDILGQASIDPQASLVDLGASSLSLMRLIARIHGRYGVLVELDELFSGLGLSGLAELIESRRAAADPDAGHAAPARAPGAVPLSEFQLPFWEVREYLPAKRAYNEPLAYLVETELDHERCRAVLERIVAAHPVLRSAFVESPDGSPVRRVLAVAEIDPLTIEERDFSGEPDPFAACRARAAELARTDFDLARPPLFQAFAWRLAPGRWLVGCILYHIVVDLWAAQLLAREAARLYLAETPDDSTEGADAGDMGGETLLPGWDEADAAFWRDALRERPEPPSFPARPRPAIKSYRGGLVQGTLRHAYSRDIEPARRALGVTASSLTLAAFGVLLSAVAGTDDLVVGVPHLLRERPEAQKVVGMFLNTLPIRLRAADGMATGEFVSAVHAELVAALSHASYPVHRMQAQAGVRPSLGRAPLYDHLFTYYEGLGDAESQGASEISLPMGTSKLDLSCFVRRRGDSLDCRLEYSSDLFAESDAAGLLAGYESALERVVSSPRASVAETRASLIRALSDASVGSLAVGHL